MGPTWALSAPDGPHACPMNLVIDDMRPTKHDHWYKTLQWRHILVPSEVTRRWWVDFPHEELVMRNIVSMWTRFHTTGYSIFHSIVIVPVNMSHAIFHLHPQSGTYNNRQSYPLYMYMVPAKMTECWLKKRCHVLWQLNDVVNNL